MAGRLNFMLEVALADSHEEFCIIMRFVYYSGIDLMVLSFGAGGGKQGSF